MTDKDFIDSMIKKMMAMDSTNPTVPKTKKQIAKKILTKLENDPELFGEFNMLLRRKKIKRIRDGKK